MSLKLCTAELVCVMRADVRECTHEPEKVNEGSNNHSDVQYLVAGAVGIKQTRYPFLRNL